MPQYAHYEVRAESLFAALADGTADFDYKVDRGGGELERASFGCELAITCVGGGVLE